MTGPLSLILLIGALLLGLGLLFFGLSTWWQGRTHISSTSAVLASDVAGHGQVLYSEQYKLYGKPDYIIQEKVKGKMLLVPVELKPSRRSKKLYQSDELQLVSYILLLQENYPGQAAPYGRINYAPDIPPFTVALTATRIKQVVKARDEILNNRSAQQVHRSHNIKGKCLGCGYKNDCPESLAG